jgi:hypothetical protein
MHPLEKVEDVALQGRVVMVGRVSRKACSKLWLTKNETGPSLTLKAPKTQCPESTITVQYVG